MLQIKQLFTISCFFHIIFLVKCEIIRLDGQDWSLRSPDDQFSLDRAAVPGDVTTALYHAGIIDDPLKRYNELEYRYIVEKNWTYSKVFTVEDSVLQENRVEIEFEGIDTISDVYFNGVYLGSTYNQFRKWRFDIKSLTKANDYNILEVRLISNILWAQQKEREYPYSVPYTNQEGGVPSRHFIRKVQSDYGWDWGPAFVPMGIWKSVYVRAYSTPYIEYIVVNQEQFGNDVKLNVTVFLRSASSCIEHIVAHVAGVSSERSLSFSSAQEKSISLELMIKNPKLWWPSGYGDPFLFDLKISSNSDFATRKIGFRSIKLVEEDYSDDIGKSFYFKINGLPIFIKGSNLIPFDPFSTRIHGNDYRKMLENAVLANMNMIRVWGGGMYQFDEFYDIADELGIMIWQEFVFACGMYPRNDEFLENVKIEVRENVKRLGYHASIAIFGGNNENEEAFWWYPESAANIQLYMVDYAALYLDSVYPTLFSILYDREWVQSSPSGGKISSDPLVYRFGALNDIHFGDKHFYDYENDCTDVSHFPRARFISEYGQQSWPSFDLLKSVSDVMDWGWDSNFSYYRQRHPDGQFQLNRQMRRHFTLTNATLSRSAKGFDDWIYLTQITQVRCYTSSISYWRRIKHESPGKTMGVLYWQLNDIWQGPSWSSVQYDGKWKPLHYHIKNVFAGVLVSAQVYPTNNFSVYVTSDVYSEFESSLHINLWTWSGEKVKSVSKDYISVSSFSSEAAFIDSLSNFLHPFTESDVFAELVLTSRDGNVLLSRNEYFFGSFSLAKIEDPRITVRLIHDQSDPKIIRFELESMSIAPFVFLESNL